MAADVLDPDPTAIRVGADGRVRALGEQTRSLLGDAAVGKKLTDLVDRPIEAEEALAQFRRTSNPLPAALRLRSDAPDSLLRPVVGQRMRGSSDVRIEFREPGENRFAELNDMLDRLHREVRRRRRAEAELHHVLASTVADLSDANERLAEFTRTAAHDLRTPLTVITGFAEVMLAEHELSDASESLTRRIVKAGRACAELIDQMLDAAQDVSADRAELVDLQAEVERVRLLLATDALRVIHGELETLVAPRTSLRQVLLNLVTNSVKHRGERTRITVHIASAPTQDGWKIVVSDDGPGIAPENFEKVFDEGTQLAGSGPGTGLGLGQCRRLVQRWGGDLRLETADSGGLRVVIVIPA